jgi:hypothetical protein
MQAKCRWGSTLVAVRCSVQDCKKDARLFCYEHPDEGYFCALHRHRHTQSINRKNAEMDSRPRDLAKEVRSAANLEDLPNVMNGGLIPEGANLVGS